MKALKIATLGMNGEYRSSLVARVLECIGYQLEWVKPIDADIVVFGSFKSYKYNLKYVPGRVRKQVRNLLEEGWRRRKIPPITLFHTGECLRHNHVKADFSISHDLGVPYESHFRMPYWMDLVDWSHEGVVGNQNPRFGQLLSLSSIAKPLGRDFLSRPRKAAIFTTHLQEPRGILINVLKKHLPVDGYGSYFDSSIADHNNSPIQKLSILKDYAFNLCPENTLYPGYYTEKIPEAFLAGCLPLTWADPNVFVDFNPDAMVNMHAMAATNFAELGELLASDQKLREYAEQPLIVKEFSIEPLKAFLRKVAEAAL